MDPLDVTHEVVTLVIGCAVDPTQSPVVCFICLPGLLRRLRLAMVIHMAFSV